MLSIGNSMLKFANLPATKRVVEWAAKNEGANLARVKRHLPAAIGIWMTTFYALNNLKSDKIPKERKIPLLINDMINCTFGVVGGYILSGAIFKFKDALVSRFGKIIANNPEKLLLAKGLSSFIPLVAFSFMFRYIGPVFATPLADKIVKGLMKLAIVKDPAMATKEKASQKKALASVQLSQMKLKGLNFDITVGDNLKNNINPELQSYAGRVFSGN